MPMFCGVNGAKHKISKLFTGIDGAKKSIKEMWAGNAGAKRKIFSSEITISWANIDGNRRLVTSLYNNNILLYMYGYGYPSSETVKAEDGTFTVSISNSTERSISVTLNGTVVQFGGKGTTLYTYQITTKSLSVTSYYDDSEFSVHIVEV